MDTQPIDSLEPLRQSAAMPSKGVTKRPQHVIDEAVKREAGYLANKVTTSSAKRLAHYTGELDRLHSIVTCSTVTQVSTF